MIKFNKTSVSIDYDTYVSLRNAALSLLDVLDKPDAGSLFCYSNENLTCFSLRDVYILSCIIEDYQKLLNK